jgi:hypothetical protein
MHISNVKGLSFSRHRDPARSSVTFSYVEADDVWRELSMPLMDALSMLNTLRHLEADQDLQELTRVAAAMSSMQFAPPDLPLTPDTRVAVRSAAVRASLNDGMLARYYDRVLRNELAVAVGSWVSAAELTIPAIGERLNTEFALGFDQWTEPDYFEHWNDFVTAAEAKIGSVEFRTNMWNLLHGVEPTERQRLVAALPVSNFIDLTLDRALAKALRARGKQPIEQGPLSGMMGSWKQTEPNRPNVFYAMEYPPIGGHGWGGVRSTILKDDIVKANAGEMLRRKDLLLVGLTSHEAEFILHLHLFSASGEKIVNCSPYDADPSYWARRGVYVSNVRPELFVRGLLPADGNAFGTVDAIVPAPMIVDIHRRPNHAFISHSRRDDAFVDWLTGMLRLRGVSYWRDQREIEVGDPVSVTIQTALNAVYCFVVVLSPDALQSTWVSAEIREAVALSTAGKLRIIPVLLGDCAIPDELVALDYADFRSGRSEGELDRLVRSIRTAADRIDGKA